MISKQQEAVEMDECWAAFEDWHEEIYGFTPGKTALSLAAWQGWQAAWQARATNNGDVPEVGALQPHSLKLLEELQEELENILSSWPWSILQTVIANEQIAALQQPKQEKANEAI